MCNNDEKMVNEQIKEAVSRMKSLDLLERIIREFEEKNSI